MLLARRPVRIEAIPVLYAHLIPVPRDQMTLADPTGDPAGSCRVGAVADPVGLTSTFGSTHWQPPAPATHMLGQLCEPLPEWPGKALLPWPGVVGAVRGGAVAVVVELPLVELVDVAAFAIAAPPPAIAAVAATVTNSGLRLRICSPPFVLTAADVALVASDPGRSGVRVS
jgi:hypothetical protein